jgi:hypothetical protein
MLLAAGGMAMYVVAMQAHHSIAGYYDSSRQVTLEGVIAEFHFVNPHPFVLLDVTPNNGAVQKWRLEMDNRGELAQIGVTSETFKKGDRILVSGSPARSQPQGLYVLKLDRPADGLRYEQIGTSPRIRRWNSAWEPPPRGGHIYF